MNWRDYLFFDFVEIRKKLIVTPTKLELQNMTSIFYWGFGADKPSASELQKPSRNF